MGENYISMALLSGGFDKTSDCPPPSSRLPSNMSTCGSQTCLSVPSYREARCHDHVTLGGWSLWQVRVWVWVWVCICGWVIAGKVCSPAKALGPHILLSLVWSIYMWSDFCFHWTRQQSIYKLGLIFIFVWWNIISLCRHHYPYDDSEATGVWERLYLQQVQANLLSQGRLWAVLHHTTTNQVDSESNWYIWGVQL